MKTYHKIKTLWKRTSERPCNMMVDTFTLPEFELLKDIEWIATEKVDGTNVRIMWDGNKVKFGGKTDNAQMQLTLVDKLTELFGGEASEQLFEQTFSDEGGICLYGEGYGTKIQKGGGLYGDVNFVLFDVKIGSLWLDRDSIEDIAKQLGIQVVPIIARGTLKELSDFTVKGIKSIWGDFEAEGIIAKPVVELLDRRGHRVITKLKCKDFAKLK